MNETMIRPYELSVWGLQDNPIIVLKHSSLNHIGQVITPKITMKTDGTEEISFSIPMYIRSNGEQIENPLWKNTRNGDIVKGLRKIKVIFNKGEKDFSIQEFLITEVEDQHVGHELFCNVKGEGLAFQQAGKVGYKIALSQELFELEYEKWIEGEIDVEPRATLNYWAEETLKNTSWDYEINMDWSGYDGIPVLNYDKMTSGERDILNEERESNGLRRMDTVYENEFVSAWEGVYEEDAEVPSSLRPVEARSFVVKERLIDAEKSNIYNITQSIAENFGVFCRYEYEYDESYHIVGRKCIFYNTYLDEQNTFDITFSNNTTDITRKIEVEDVYTKMYVTPLEDETSSSGLITIADAKSNRTGEDYILNFDHLYEIGAIGDEQYQFIKDYELKIYELNKNLTLISASTSELTLEQNELYGQETLLENSRTEAREQMDEALDKIAAIVGDGILSKTAAAPDLAAVRLNSDGRLYIMISQEGVDKESVKAYTIYSSGNLSGLMPMEAATYEIDEYGNLTSITWPNIAPMADNTRFWLTYTYTPKTKYENIYNSFKTRESSDTAQLDGIKARIQTISEQLDDLNQRFDYIIQEKTALIARFERIMGPALREGSWSPDEYTDYGNHYTEQLSLSSPSSEHLSLFWDTEVEQKNYIEEGVNQTKRYFYSINLSSYLTAIKDFAQELRLYYIDNSVVGSNKEKTLIINSKLQYGYYNNSGTIIPVLMVTDTTIPENTVKNSAKLGYEDNEGIHYLATISAAHWITNQTTLASYSFVCPRISLNLNPVKVNDGLYISIDEVDLEKYYDYNIYYKNDGPYITIKNHVFIERGLTNEISISFIISNGSLSMFLDALEVSKSHAYPQVSYSVKLAPKNHEFLKEGHKKLGKIAHINDSKMGFKNVLGYVSEITLDLDQPWNDGFVIANYKTKFEDLFSTIVASSEQMKNNEYIYNRAGGAFNSLGALHEENIQASLDQSNLKYSFLKGRLSISEQEGIWATSDNGVVAIRGGGIFAATSKDDIGNWNWNTGITPEGINASLIRSGQLDTNLIRIFAGDNVRLQLNSDGVVAYRANNDGSTNPDERVIHNSEGLFLKNKVNDQVIDRVEVSWNGFIIRNDLNQKVFYADENGNLVLSGHISANTGEIGGWQIKEKSLEAQNGNIGMASDGSKDAQGNFDAFWAGKDGLKSYRVLSDGTLYASNANISGTINALAGNIGKLTVDQVQGALMGIDVESPDGQNFKYRSTGPETQSVENPTMRFTAVATGIVPASYLWQKSLDHNTWYLMEGTNNTNEYLFNSTNMTIGGVKKDIIYLRCSVVANEATGGLTYTSTIPVYNMYDGYLGKDGEAGKDGADGVDGAPGAPGAAGEDGLSAITVTSSNPAHVFPASSDGTISSYADGGTIIRVFEGATELTYQSGTDTPAVEKFTVIATGTNITAGAGSLNGQGASYSAPGNMTADSAQIAFTIRGKRANGDEFTIILTQSFSKSKAGRGISSTVIEYVVVDSGSSVPSSGWSTTLPTSIPEGKFLWTRTTISYTGGGANTVTYTVAKQGISGSKGDQGEAGKGIASTAITYGKNTDGTITPNALGWKNTIAELSLAEGEFLITRTLIIYTDDSTTTSYSLAKQGVDGAAGEDGQDGADAKLLYLTATSEVIKYDATGTPDVTEVALEVKLQNVSGTPTVTAQRYIGATINGSSFTLTAPYKILSSHFTGNTTSIRVTATLGSLSDIVTISKVQDGEKGEDGAAAILTNLVATGHSIAYANGGATQKSPNISVQANRVNHSGTILWEVTKYVGTATNGTISKTGNPIEITALDMAGSTTSIKVRAYTTSPVTEDTITIYKLLDGEEALTLVLTNQSHTYSADPDGNIISYAGGGTDIQVFEGSNELTYLNTGVATAGKYKVTAIGSGIQPASQPAIIEGVKGAHYAEPSSFTSDNGKIIFVITGVRANGKSFSLTGEQTFAKAIAGADGADGAKGDKGDKGDTGSAGANAKLIMLVASHQIFKINTSGISTPLSLTITGVAQNTSITTWTYSINGGSFSSTVPSGVSRSGNIVTIIAADMTASTIVVQASDGTYSDTVTISKVSDGAPGSNGAPGADAYTVLLDNESHIFPGSTSAALNTNVTFGVIALKGTTEMPIKVGTISGKPTGMTISISNNETLHPSIQLAVTSAMNTAAGILLIPIEVDGISFVKQFSFSIAFKGATGSTGAPGADAKLITLTPTQEVFKVSSTGTTPSTIEVVGTTQNTTISSWLYSSNGGTPVNTVPAGVSINGNKVTLTAATMTATTITIIASDGTYSDSVTISKVTDGSDAYTVLLTNESHIFPGSDSTAVASSTAFNVVAFKGGTQVSATVGSITGNPNGMSIAVTNNPSTSPLITITVNTNLITPSGTLTIPIVVDGKSFTKQFSYSIGFKGQAGSDGKGISSTVVRYQASSSGTTTPTGTWLSSIPAVSASQYLWTRTVITYTDDTSSTSYSIGMMGAKGSDGTPGAAGTNQATIYLYKRATSTPAITDIADPITYTFSTAAISGTIGTWSRSVPTGTDPIYVISAAAISSSASDTIARSEWSAPVIMGSSGVNSAVVLLYRRATSAPAKPSAAITYTFSTGVATGMTNGWVQTPPATNGNPLWVIQAVATATAPINTASITAASWGTQIKLVEDGATGKGIISITEQYYLSTSKTEQIGSSWKTEPDPWSPGKYLWTRSDIRYTDAPNTAVYTTAVCDTGWEAVNEVQVGGRNLIRDTEPEWETYAYIGSPYGAYKEGPEVTGVFEDLVDKPVMISFDIFIENPTDSIAGVNVRGQLGTPKYGMLYVEIDGIPTNIWTRVSTPIEIVDYSEWNTGDCSIEISGMDEYPSSTKIRIRKFKLERGNKATDWTPAPEDVDAQIAAMSSEFSQFESAVNAVLEEHQNQIDGSITTWFYEYDPKGNNYPASSWTTTGDKNRHLGDLFYNTLSGYAYRWQVIDNVYSWILIKDTDVTKALSDAAAAQDTADSKRRVFTSTPTPPYDVGDLWTQGASGELMRCKTAKASGAYSAADWEKASKYTDDTKANEVDNKVQNLNIGGTNLIPRSSMLTLTDAIFVDNLDPDTNHVFSVKKVLIPEGSPMPAGITWELINNDTQAIITSGMLDISYGKQVRKFTTPSAQDVNYSFVMYAGIKGDTAGNTVEFVECQLEEGDYATAWKPSPADAMSQIGETENALTTLDQGMKDRVMGIIEALDLEDTFANAEDFVAWVDELKEVQSTLKTDGEDISMIFETLDIVNGNISEIKSQIIFGDDGEPFIEMKTSDSEMKMKLTNNRLSFIHEGSGETVAYFSSNKLYVTQLEIINRFSIGTLANGFLDIITTPTGVGFKWRVGSG